MLILNQRVRFRGALCQVVAVTPVGGNTTYKLKHVETDKVLDGDFVHDDELEVVEPEVASKEEQEMLKRRRKKLNDKFGDQPTSDGELRDMKLAALHEDDSEPPVPEVQHTLGAPKPPIAPGLHDDVESSFIPSDDAPHNMDYSNPDGSENRTTPDTLKRGAGLNGIDPNPIPADSDAEHDDDDGHSDDEQHHADTDA